MNNELTEEDFVQLFLLCVQDGRNDVLWNSMKAMGYSMEFDFPMEFPEDIPGGCGLFFRASPGDC